MENENSGKILSTAEAFGYGPASKLLMFFRRIQFQSLQLTFLGNGCAYELCKESDFHRIVHADPTDVDDNGSLHLEIEKHNVFISAMEFSPLAASKKAGLNTIMLDSLFWMWPKIPCELEAVDLYLCQNFIGVREKVMSCRNKKLIVIPPLTFSDGLRLNHGNKNIILNFGGMDNPFAKKYQIVNYAILMFKLVEKICSDSGLNLEVYGRKWVIDELKFQFGKDRAIFSCLPLPSFINRLKKAECLVTSPGLEVMYEAFTIGVPVFMLPPQNNSQSYQAQRLIQEIPDLPGPQYSDLIGKSPLHFNQPPEAAIQMVLNDLYHLKDMESSRKKLQQALEKFLNADRKFFDRLCLAQSQFMEKMKNTADISKIEDLQPLLDKNV